MVCVAADAQVGLSARAAVPNKDSLDGGLLDRIAVIAVLLEKG
jgi:hypothetical protein